MVSGVVEWPAATVDAGDLVLRACWRGATIGSSGAIGVGRAAYRPWRQEMRQRRLDDDKPQHAVNKYDHIPHDEADVFFRDEELKEAVTHVVVHGHHERVVHVSVVGEVGQIDCLVPSIVMAETRFKERDS